MTDNNRPTVEEQEYHLNKPQMMYSLIRPQIGVCIWGRYTGKTDGPGSDFTLYNVLSMPRSNGFIQGKTYAQLVEKTLDALVTGWEKRGFKQNVHFWIGKFPPEELNLPKPIRRPISPAHYISWYNGSGIYLVSQDKFSSINGVRSQWGFVDEARFINKKKFDEQTIPTMAGGINEWGHLSNYLSLLFCSDQPQTSSEKWLLDFGKLMDEEQLELILSTQCKISILEKEIEQSTSEKTITKAKKELTRYNKLLNELRKESVFFSEASALENISNVGLQPIENSFKTLSETKFRVQIMNERIIRNESGFYSMLDPDKHGYDSVNNSFVDKLTAGIHHQRDCRWDADLNYLAPLDFSLDHNNAINSIVTGQYASSKLYRLLSAKYVLHPELLSHCIMLWHEYYKHFLSSGCAEVNYYFDSTSIPKRASTDINFSDEIISTLTELGWKVNPYYIGQIGSHHSRYLMWGKLFSGEDKRLPAFRYNRNNCLAWETSALNAGIIKIGEEVKKDKSSERKDSGVPPQDATHLSEAADILLYAKLRRLFNNRQDFVGMIHSH